ncbi:hypothetical protein [Emticicia sp. 17c]|uniref:hypothetical protein n=1 Tax=Emticicia sp. 17c TaxID=3127704 RepID=UPI00301DF3B6
MKNYLKQYESINLAALPDDISQEFTGIYENTNGFTAHVELEAQNFEDLMEIVKTAFPEAIQQKPSGKVGQYEKQASRLKTAKTKRKTRTTQQAQKRQENKKTKAASPSKAAPTKPKATTTKAKTKVTKQQDKYKQKLETLQEQREYWFSKVAGQEENLEKVLKLLRPTNKGLGMSRVQVQIKRLEADISVLKKVFSRNSRIENAILEKARKALDPMGVKSLKKAIEKAQKLYEKEQAMD